jgi:hypothetical protein
MCGAHANPALRAAARSERSHAAVFGRVARVSDEVAVSATAMATPQPTADARRRQIHPRNPLMYSCEQTHATVQADRLQKKAKR